MLGIIFNGCLQVAACLCVVEVLVGHAAILEQFYRLQYWVSSTEHLGRFGFLTHVLTPSLWHTELCRRQRRSELLLLRCNDPLMVLMQLVERPVRSGGSSLRVLGDALRFHGTREDLGVLQHFGIDLGN